MAFSLSASGIVAARSPAATLEKKPLLTPSDVDGHAEAAKKIVQGVSQVIIATFRSKAISFLNEHKGEIENKQIGQVIDLFIMAHRNEFAEAVQKLVSQGEAESFIIDKKSIDPLLSSMARGLGIEYAPAPNRGKKNTAAGISALWQKFREWIHYP